MARTLRCVVRLEEDGRPVSGFPLVRELVVDESQEWGLRLATLSGFHPLPIEVINAIRVLAVRAVGGDVTLRLSGQTSAGILIRDGGLVLLFGADICTPLPQAGMFAQAATEAKIIGIGGA